MPTHTNTDHDLAQTFGVGEEVEAIIARAQGGTMRVRGRVVAAVGKRFRVVFQRADSTEFELSLARAELFKVEQRSPVFRDCGCPQKPDGSLDTPRSEHLCALRVKRRSGPSGKCSPAAIARKRAKQAAVAIDGGSAALAEAAKRAGYESGSAFVTAAIQHVRAGGKFISR